MVGSSRNKNVRKAVKMLIKLSNIVPFWNITVDMGEKLMPFEIINCQIVNESN